MTTPFKGEPAIAAACDEAWIALRREIIEREGYALRAYTHTAGAQPVHRIELKSLRPIEQLAAHDPLRINAWCVLALPNEATGFVSASERDAVLARLQSANAPALNSLA